MNELNLNSRLKDLYASPVGHDTLAKVLMQLGLSEKLICNPIVSNLKLRNLAALTRKQLGDDFWQALLQLVNSEQGAPAPLNSRITPKWWKEAVFYQIYPRSFYDTNGDGIGDLQGIIQKLDYLQELGVNALWLSPIYDSPNDDNGYDIRNYHKIMAEFGTMEDFELLLEQVHTRDMRLIMDLVVNHTSDEHPWFQQALQDPNSKYRDYYFFRKASDLPNNWTSFFSGPAWNYYPEQDIWALHLFSKKQMDLNWDNPALRKDVIDMVNWWLDKGVDGFRMDVINYISKTPGLPQGNTVIGNMMGFTGIETYYYGPNLHQYLRQIQAEAFTPHNAFSVGETPGLGINMCRLVTGEERKELDMVFCFDHLETPGHVRMDDYEYDLNFYRDYIIDWLEHYGNNCWTALFYNNHDNPRMISKICKDSQYHTQLSILLAVLQLTLKGTPFIFQGDEMGLANYAFTSMEQITDVEAKGYYEEHVNTMGHDKVFAALLAGTREHCRVLLPWNETQSACHQGLTQTIKTDVTEAYRRLIHLRKNEPALSYGDFTVRDRQKDRFVYTRKLDQTTFLIDCNLSKRTCSAYQPGPGYQLIFPKQEQVSSKLGAYKARIWKKETSS